MTNNNFNPKQDVHNAYEKFIRYSYAIFNFNEFIFTSILITVILSNFISIIYILTIFKDGNFTIGYLTLSIIAISFLGLFLLVNIETTRLKKTKPTEEEILELEKENLEKKKKQAELKIEYETVFKFLLQEKLLSQEDYDNIEIINWRNNGVCLWHTKKGMLEISNSELFTALFKKHIE